MRQTITGAVAVSALCLAALTPSAEAQAPAPVAASADVPGQGAASRIRLLTDADLAAYRAAFAAADRGDAAAVRTALGRADDGVLAGHALARAYRVNPRGASYAALVDWLRRFRGHVYAEDLRRLALAKRPRRAAAPPGIAGAPQRPYPSGAGTPAGDSPAARAAIEEIAQRFGFADYVGGEALALAALDGPRSGQAAWWLGLIAFQAGQYERAAAYFELAADWPHHGPWGRSGARYWAGRSDLAAGRPAEALAHWTRAAEAETTFYGQLALAQLGREPSGAFVVPRLTESEAVAVLAASANARRAAALAQLGRIEEAELELRLLHNLTPAPDDRRLLAFAEALGLPGAQLRIAEFGGPEVAAGFCPSLPFAPADGWRIDRALIIAIMRQESRFETDAVSTSNARGLMQLLPSTAEDMDPGARYRRNPSALHEPALNLRLGQSYIEWLVDNFVADGDLAKLFAAYNGGPGWMSRWLEAHPGKDEDPLILLESFPRQESRNYAERVLGHVALCRARYNQPQREIEALASGRPALYAPQDRAPPR